MWDSIPGLVSSITLDFGREFNLSLSVERFSASASVWILLDTRASTIFELTYIFAPPVTPFLGGFDGFEKFGKEFEGLGVGLTDYSFKSSFSSSSFLLGDRESVDSLPNLTNVVFF